LKDMLANLPGLRESKEKVRVSLVGYSFLCANCSRTTTAVAAPLAGGEVHGLFRNEETALDSFCGTGMSLWVPYFTC
jgi:hypothetical protein